MMKTWFIAGFILTVLLTSCGTRKPQVIVEAEEFLPEIVDFNFHVRPILSDKCFACHGPDMANQKADLRLDTEEGAFGALGENGDRTAFMPGNLKKSQAYLRMISDEPEFIMPPPESRLNLTAKEIATIAKWIEQGAEYKPHWAFIPPELKKIPVVANKSNVKQPIDNFILSKLEREGLTLSEPATKETLIRRASFNLTGLPPTLEEIDDFLNDDSMNAYESVIDQLLSSKAYGERMATNWMDVARFADSDGYINDKHRDFSSWRDWIIKAFNENMPYDKFVTWQIAGDLIPGSNQESILATAFNRLNKRTSEGGIEYEEFRVEYVADRTHTLGKAFLGLSIECARCHDHKFDPISQKDYYKLFAFFNSTFEIGTSVYGQDQTPGPGLLLSTEEEQETIDYLRKTIEEQEQKIAEYKINTPGFDQWVSKTRLTSEVLNDQIEKDLIAYYPFDKFISKGKSKSESLNREDSSKPAVLSQPIIKPGQHGNALIVSDYNSVRLGKDVGWYERTDQFSVQLWVYPDTLYKEAVIFWHSESKRVGLKGYSLTLKNNKLEFIMAHSWPQNAIQITTERPLQIREWSQVTVTYDGSSKADGINIYVNGQKQKSNKDLDNLYKGILYVKNHHTYGFGGLMLGSRDKFTGAFKDGGIDEVKVFGRNLTPLEVLFTYDRNSALSLQNKTEEGEDLLRDYYTAHFNKEKNKIENKLKQTRDKENELLNSIQEIMVMGDLPKPLPTYVLKRGAFNAHGERVEPGAPESILEFDEALPKNRLGLTKWLFDNKNPLTSRVYVNRVWQMHFGKGIVRTSEDFGNQGSLPSHPELLDWLAVYFQDSDWDIKGLHKTILMSATYMQSSAISKKLAQIDPENILLARGPRFRLPAEMIRDNALSISGLLVDNIGGQSVYPYQPTGTWPTTNSYYEYTQEKGEGLYRRSLYTFWKRLAPPPSMMIFDMADRGVCTVRRRTTSTPLQALVLLNDPQFIEAARVLAEQLVRNEEDSSKRLITAFRKVTGRLPDDKELSFLDEFYRDELNNFHRHKEDALAFLSNGEHKWNKNLNPSEIAALGVVVNSIMNTDEGFTNK